MVAILWIFTRNPPTCFLFCLHPLFYFFQLTSISQATDKKKYMSSVNKCYSFFLYKKSAKHRQFVCIPTYPFLELFKNQACRIGFYKWWGGASPKTLTSKINANQEFKWSVNTVMIKTGCLTLIPPYKKDTMTKISMQHLFLNIFWTKVE